jgi:hypothetical protein
MGIKPKLGYSPTFDKMEHLVDSPKVTFSRLPRVSGAKSPARSGVAHAPTDASC